jgi:O-acetyl-ADP-ribose deacetylase (regulator of RNase III)
MLKYTEGNLLDMAEKGDFDVIVQGCNCFNTMGGGIARQIRDRYPEVANVDNKTVRGDYNKLGNWTSETVIRNNGLVVFEVINAYTQYSMSRGDDVFEYAAFNLILQKLFYRYHNKRIGFPYIGMGLAGGDSDVIINSLTIFSQTMTKHGGTVTLVKYL